MNNIITIFNSEEQAEIKQAFKEIINENLKHRNGKNRNNKSGYRNVFWNSNINKWVVSLMINGKNTRLGEFSYEALDKAGELAERMREIYYGEFKGKD